MGGLENMLNSKRKSIIVLIIIVFLFILVTTLFNGLSLFEGLKFFLFQVFGIFLPGAGILKLLKLKNITDIEQIMFSYGIGYSLGIIIYFLLVPFGLGKLELLFYIIFPIFSIWVIFSSKIEDTRVENDKEGFLICVVFIIAIFIFLLFAFSGKNELPIKINGTAHYNDLLHWVGNAIALKNGYPSINFRELTPNYKYHFFSSMQIGVVSQVTQISVMKVAMCYSYIQPIILLVFSGYSLIKRIVKNSFITTSTMILLLFTTGYEKLSSITYVSHIMIAPFGFDIALAFFMMVLFCLFLQIAQEKVNYQLLAITFVFFLVCEGAKGAVALVLLIGIAVICAYWLFIKREIKKALVYGIVILCGFLVVYVVVLNGAATVYLGGVIERSIPGIWEIVLNGIALRFTDRGCPVFLSQIFSIIIYIVISNPWTVCLTILYVIYSVCKRKIFDILDIAMLIMIICGYLFLFLFNLIGISQMYFVLAIFPCMTVLSGKMIENARSQAYLNSHNKRFLIILGIFLISAILNFFTNNSRNWARVNTIIGIKNFTQQETDPTQYMITHTEYEAYEWIQKNTSEVAIFLCDKTLKDDIFSYIPGVYTERYIYKYLDDADLQRGKDCYQNSQDALEYYISQGVEYIIQTIAISPNFECSTEQGKLIYENEEVRVYSIEQNRRQ